MTLAGCILKQVTSVDKYPSPPPEILKRKKKKKRCSNKFENVICRVDTKPPPYNATALQQKLPNYRKQVDDILFENFKLLLAIKNTHYTRGKVDSHWDHPLNHSKLYYENRVNFFKNTMAFNRILYKRLVNATPKVETTASLQKDWCKNRQEMFHRAQAEFILFPPVFVEDIEDPAFKAPEGVTRPRVQIKLRFVDGVDLGALKLELFTDVCPETCKLFLELLDGDEVGYGYVGTQFFRKVPHLYWSGGDVIYNNGFGCYAQSGRVVPIGAENYHFSHSMPGLLSMRMTPNNEMCGIFNITFKALPQFDLKNVVFGRVIRPCNIYDSMQDIGFARSTHPIIEICETKRRVSKDIIYGKRNTKFITTRRFVRKNKYGK